MAKRRLSAILALDVVGYSAMMSDNAAGVLSVLNDLYKAVVTPAVAAGEGRVVKLLGDGALIEFSSAAQAIQCAVAVQQELRKPDTPYRCPDPLRLRAGLHAGDVVIEGDDIFGDGVNIAARLQAAAQPGGILASRIFCDLAGSDVPARLVREGTRSLKGIANPIEVLSVDFSDTAEEERRASIARSQEVRFLQTRDDVSVAWVSNGEGSPVVKAPHWIGHLELDWRNPGLAPITASLADRHRLVRFDARGNGLSDWNAKDISFERYVDDMEQVFDAAGIERAPIVALSQGAAYSIAFAARCPERVTGLVIIGGFALGRAKRQSKADRDRAKAFSSMMSASWDDEFPSLRDLMAQIIIPNASEEERRLYAEDMRQMITPQNIKRIRKIVDYLDVTPLLPEIEVPCLVCHCTGDRMQPIEQGRALAAGLKNARFIAYESSNHLVTESDPVWPLLERDMHAFLADHTP